MHAGHDKTTPLPLLYHGAVKEGKHEQASHERGSKETDPLARVASSVKKSKRVKNNLFKTKTRQIATGSHLQQLVDPCTAVVPPSHMNEKITSTTSTTLLANISYHTHVLFHCWKKRREDETEDETRET